MTETLTRIVLILLAVVIIANIVFYFLIVTPEKEAIINLDRKIIELTEKRDKIRLKIEDDMVKYEEKLKETEAYLERVKSLRDNGL